jgi:hypothetical protein
MAGVCRNWFRTPRMDTRSTTGRQGNCKSLTSLRGFLTLPFSSTFVAAWQGSMKIHETMAENRIKFAQRLNEMGDELAVLVKEVEKNRKQVRHSFRIMFIFRK